MMDPLKRLRLIKYAILQTTMGPSLICDLFVFIYFIRHWRKEILMKPQNHVIACLLIASFIQKITDSPFTLYYLRWGIVVQETYTFCAIWNWLHYSLTCVSLHLLTWYCIERHLFIFHSQMMKKKYCLILFHYIPLIVCSLYTPVFYIRYIFFPPKCVNVWYYTIMLCVAPCYTYTDKFLNSFDWLFHYGMPILIIIFVNLFLFCRIISKKVKRQQRIQWNRQKRMIIQLVFISLLYLIFMAPGVIVGVIQILWTRDFLSDIQDNCFYYLFLFINQFLSFAIISSLPETRKELKQWRDHLKTFCHRGIRIHPVLPGTTVIGNETIDETRV
ncbi:unnamed protein product [Rotaria sp. Silwood1]|nr:unnamed protein product [Rotaria sp. Silwood1]